MKRNHKPVPASGVIVTLIVLINVLIIKIGFIIHTTWYWALIITVPLLLLSILNIRQKNNAVLRDFPIIGYFFLFFEVLRPALLQHYFESGQKGKYSSVLQQEVEGKTTNMDHQINGALKQNKREPGCKWVGRLSRPVSLHELKNGLAVHSQLIHSEFDTSEGLVQFFRLLQESSGGKPLDFKIDIGGRDQLVESSGDLRSSGIIKIDARIRNRE